MADLILSYETPVRRPRIVVSVLLLLAFWAMVDVLTGGVMCVVAAVAGVVEMGDLRPLACLWAVMFVCLGIALCCWGVWTMKMAIGVFRRRPNALEVVCQQIRNAEIASYGGVLIIGVFAINYAEMKTIAAFFAGACVYVVVPVAVTLTRLWVRYAMRITTLPVTAGNLGAIG